MVDDGLKSAKLAGLQLKTLCTRSVLSSHLQPTAGDSRQRCQLPLDPPALSKDKG
jgi:hypothetical protein